LIFHTAFLRRGLIGADLIQIQPCLINHRNQKDIPETVQDGSTFICFDVDIQSVSNKTFLTPVLYIWVMSHRSTLRLPEGGVRPDKICSEICKVINGSRYYGLGELNLYSVKRFVPLTDYQGKLMTFYAKEFNRQFDGAKPAPVNRKG